MSYPTIARSWIELQIARRPNITGKELLSLYDEMKANEARNFRETVERKANEKRMAEVQARLEAEAKRQNASKPKVHQAGDIL